MDEIDDVSLEDILTPQLYQHGGPESILRLRKMIECQLLVTLLNT